MPSSIESNNFESKDASSHDSRIERVTTAGEGNEFVILGNHKYYRHELMAAFGGNMNNERMAPRPKRLFGNAAAMGLSAFATTTFTLGLYLAGAMGIEKINVVIGLCFWYGGFAEAMAGIWELIMGNTFAGTVLTSFGMGFWLSYAAINVEAFGIAAAYGDDAVQFLNAVGHYLLAWGLFDFVLVLLTVKSTLVFCLLFVTLDVAFLSLAAAYYLQHLTLMKVGGVFCVISACCGWFCAFAGVATEQNSYITANPIPLPVWNSKTKKFEKSV